MDENKDVSTKDTQLIRQWHGLSRAKTLLL
jgi:hypothetical protein